MFEPTHLPGTVISLRAPPTIARTRTHATHDTRMHRAQAITHATMQASNHAASNHTSSHTVTTPVFPITFLCYFPFFLTRADFFEGSRKTSYNRRRRAKFQANQRQNRKRAKRRKNPRQKTFQKLFREFPAWVRRGEQGEVTN